MFGLSDPPTDPHPLDELFDESIEVASRWSDQWCRRHFYQVTETREFIADDLAVLRFGTFGDVVSVTAVESDDLGDGVFVAWNPAEFLVPPASAGPEARPSRTLEAVAKKFPLGRRVRVTGTWGWPAVPAPVARGTTIQAARLVKRREAPEGILGVNQFGVLRVAGRPDPDVVSLLNPYRLRVVG